MRQQSSQSFRLKSLPPHPNSHLVAFRSNQKLVAQPHNPTCPRILIEYQGKKQKKRLQIAEEGILPLRGVAKVSITNQNAVPVG
jgi:hypothetical protein